MSCHDTDLDYFWNHKMYYELPTDEERSALSDDLIGYYANFVRTGNPNDFSGENPNMFTKHRNLPSWNSVGTSPENWNYLSFLADATMNINHTTVDENYTRRLENCDFWDEINEYGLH